MCQKSSGGNQYLWSLRPVWRLYYIKKSIKKLLVGDRRVTRERSHRSGKRLYTCLSQAFRRLCPKNCDRVIRIKEVVRQLVRQLVYTMFISNFRASFHLWWKENLLKHQRFSKYYKNDCLQNFLLHYMSLLRAKFVKSSHI